MIMFSDKIIYKLKIFYYITMEKKIKSFVFKFIIFRNGLIYSEIF